MNCLRCNGKMTNVGNYKFESQDNNRGIFGAIFDVEKHLSFEIYVCEKCKSSEFKYVGSSTRFD